MPCDDPERSSFTKFFLNNFDNLKLGRLISTSYFGSDKPGKILDVDNVENIDVENVDFGYLRDNGDFRSQEVTELRDESDFVITNPPFSLFRQFLPWAMENGTRITLMGNLNSITYKEVFPLIQDGLLWLGSGAKNPTKFLCPNSNGSHDLRSLGNVRWFTNVEHGRRRESIPLLTLAKNMAQNDRVRSNPGSYRKYDNFNAIEVPSVSSTPSDYNGVMGVPITFLEKHDPQQFEIVGFRKGDDGKDLRYTLEDGTTKFPYCRILINPVEP